VGSNWRVTTREGACNDVKYFELRPPPLYLNDDKRYMFDVRPGVCCVLCVVCCVLCVVCCVLCVVYCVLCIVCCVVVCCCMLGVVCCVLFVYSILTNRAHQNI